MVAFWIFLGLITFVLISSFLFYCITFFVPNKGKIHPEFEMPPGKIYEPYYPQMRTWMEQLRDMPRKDFSIRTFDGLTLWGTYYEYAPGAPIELMFHGYRGTADRDLCGGVQRAFSLGHSALIVDQRASCRSGGHTITFGYKESRDCLCWVNFMVQHFGADVRIILCGISMGATTVLMASGENLPRNVIGVLADCGFTNAKDIICKVIRQLKLPARLLYPLVRFGAILYGGFDPNRANATAAVKNCRVPVIFFHGQADDYVPWQMSQINHDACPTAKKLVLTPGAGHGLSYLKTPDAYIEQLRQFEKHWGL